MEYLSVVITDPADAATSIPALRRAKGESLGVLNQRIRDGKPAAVFHYGSNDIDEAIDRTRRLLDSLDAAGVRYRLLESEDEDEAGVETTREVVTNAFDSWSEIDEDRMDADDRRFS